MRTAPSKLTPLLHWPRMLDSGSTSATSLYAHTQHKVETVDYRPKVHGTNFMSLPAMGWMVQLVP